MESILFDIVFMVQHYLLYTNRADPVAKYAAEKGGAGESANGSDSYEQLNSPINVDDKLSSADGSNGHNNHNHTLH